MKKLNKKGFILVETLVVTVFVVTMFIVVYQSTIPILGDYERYNKYEDIDIIYNANLYRQMLTKYGNLTFISDWIDTHIYLDITDCDKKSENSNIPIYLSPAYCHLVQQTLNITENDSIILTDYDITAFKSTVNDIKYVNEFDSGTRSNFKDYVNMVPNVEPWYDNAISGKVGKYRLFIIKNIVNADGSKSRKYTNLGIYDGINKSYVMGEKVTVKNLFPGATNEKFYVLKNSNSYDKKVTLIYSKNLPNSKINFSYGSTAGTLINKLKTGTDSWNTDTLVDTIYYSKYDNDISTSDNYRFNYNNLHARLLDEYDIYEALGCKNEAKECFDPDNAFIREFDNEKFKFLTDNLGEDDGYWTATTVPYTNMYAWAIQKGKIVPVNVNDSNMGIRPIIVVDKSRVSREGEE